MMLLWKVVSGGQTGADQAGLKAAKDSGLVTGGWAPKGCMTLDGPNMDLVNVYDLQERESKDYADRTAANVRDSDGTLRFARNFSSPGECCTFKALHQHKKPYFNYPMWELLFDEADMFDKTVAWVLHHGIKVLNIAGNSEKTAPGIYDKTYAILIKLFARLKELDKG